MRNSCQECGCRIRHGARCKPCRDRAWWRENRAGGDPVLRERRRCASCGTEAANQTAGCKTCSDRHSKRRAREAVLA